MINTKTLLVSAIGSLFLLSGCSQQPEIKIKKVCKDGIYLPKYDVCQLTNKSIKGVVSDIKSCVNNKCIYVVNDEINNKIKIKAPKGKYKVGDIVNIILYEKPQIKKIKEKK